MLTDAQKVTKYIRKVSQHLYAHKNKAFKIHGGTIKYDSTGGFYGVEITYDEIHYHKDEDGIAIQGVVVGKNFSVSIHCSIEDNLQYVKNVVRRKLTRESTSMRKKYWTKLVRQLKSILKTI